MIMHTWRTKWLARRTGGALVFLRDTSLQVYPSIAYKDVFGNHYAFVDPYNTTRDHCILDDGGKVNEACRGYKMYGIREWRPA